MMTLEGYFHKTLHMRAREEFMENGCLCVIFTVMRHGLCSDGCPTSVFRA